MINALPVFCFIALAFVVMAMKSIATAQEDERLVVVRLGQLVGVCGPGINIVLPFIDRVIRIKVESIAGWRELSESELQKRAAQIALEAGK
jgi:regulator of protease activity HflC (stomatin/prohibitin superfamily)